MAKNPKSPIEIICIVVKRGESKKVIDILAAHGVDHQINCLAEGTAKSSVQDLFGFEILDRDMLFGIIATDKTKNVFKDLNETFDISDLEQVCLAFTMPLSSATSTMLDMLGITI